MNWMPDSLKMMRGSEGREDYLIVGQKGPYALGVKHSEIVPGEAVGATKSTYVVLRIRCQKEFEETETTPDNPEKAWPITWHKVAKRAGMPAMYASKRIGSLVEGDIRTEPQNIIEKLDDGSLARNAALALQELVGEEHMVLSLDALANYLQGQFDNVIAPIVKAMSETKAVYDLGKEVAKETNGGFTDHASLLKKKYDKLKGKADDDE